MRIHRTRARLLAAIGFVGLLGAVPTPGAAATTVDIRFTSTTGGGTTGSNIIHAGPGDVLTATVSIQPDSVGVSNYVVSLEFDVGRSDVLDLVSATELQDPSFQLNLDSGCASTQESTDAQEGAVLSCEAATLQDGPPPPPSVDVAEIVFQVTGNILNANSQVRAGFFNPGIDGMFDNDGNSLSPSFGGAVVLPEPGTEALLVGLALISLLQRTRRRPIPNVASIFARELEEKGADVRFDLDRIEDPGPIGAVNAVYPEAVPVGKAQSIFDAA